MNFGYQTIIFGPRIEDLPSVLDLIAAAGFSGVEFSQRCDMLAIKGEGKVNIKRLRELLSERNLTFLGLAGGTVEERMDFCDGISKDNDEAFEPFKPLYLYVEECNAPLLEKAALRRFHLALHPHVFMKNHRLEDAKKCLDSCDISAKLRNQGFSKQEAEEFGLLYWMPDTAHLHLVGDSAVKAVELLPQSRLIAIHLKDWDPSYGRSYHRYARGFTSLERGSVPILQVLSKLKAMDYAGWCIVEQDHMQEALPLLADATTSVHTAAQWLINKGYMPREHRLHSNPPMSRSLDNKTAMRQTHDSAAMLEFTRSVFDASANSLPECYKLLAQALRKLYDARHVSIWACSAARSDMSLLASDPYVKEGDHVLRKHRAYIGKAVDTLAVEEQNIEFSDTDNSRTSSISYDGIPSGRSYQWQTVAAKLGAEKVISFPILNRFNHHHIRLMVAILPGEHTPKIDTIESLSIGEYIARASDASLDDLCSHAAARVNVLADRYRDLSRFLTALLDLIRDTIECEGLTIFVINAVGDRLIVGATTGIEWARPEARQSYGKSDNNTTSNVWLRNEPVLVWHAQQLEFDGKPHPWKSREKGANVTSTRDNLLLVPIVALESEGSKVIGVVRCRNKKIINLEQLNVNVSLEEEASLTHVASTAKERIFTDDDAAVLDAICHAAVPHIKLLQSDIQRARAVAKLTHELNVPLVATKGAIAWLKHDLEKMGIHKTSVFKYDYAGDVLSWTELMHRLVGNADIYGGKFGQRDLQPLRTLLMADIVAPSVRQVNILLRARKFDPDKISYSSFADIPALYVDRNQFQQVFFNLLSNSIKYAFNDAEKFRIEIDTEQDGRWFYIRCRDWGPGIIDQYREMIFEEGARGPDSLNKVVAGQGLGLWVSRQIIDLHGGSVEVTNLYDPTEFTIKLPLSLASAPPKRTTRKS